MIRHKLGWESTRRGTRRYRAEQGDNAGKVYYGSRAESAARADAASAKPRPAPKARAKVANRKKAVPLSPAQMHEKIRRNYRNGLISPEERDYLLANLDDGGSERGGSAEDEFRSYVRSAKRTGNGASALHDGKKLLGMLKAGGLPMLRRMFAEASVDMPKGGFAKAASDYLRKSNDPLGSNALGVAVGLAEGRLYTSPRSAALSLERSVRDTDRALLEAQRVGDLNAQKRLSAFKQREMKALRFVRKNKDAIRSGYLGHSYGSGSPAVYALIKNPAERRRLHELAERTARVEAKAYSPGDLFARGKAPSELEEELRRWRGEYTRAAEENPHWFAGGEVRAKVEDLFSPYAGRLRRDAAKGRRREAGKLWDPALPFGENVGYAGRRIWDAVRGRRPGLGEVRERLRRKNALATMSPTIGKTGG